MQQRPKGIIAAIPTAITETGEIDTATFMKVAQYLLTNGCDGLNVLGTTGEATSFSLAQRMALMSAVKAQGLPMNRLMVGTGAAAVADAVALTRHAAELGFAGALILPPFYYKGVPDAGVFAYLERIIRASEQTPIPIYLYNFPANSGVLYNAALVDSLIKAFPNRMAGLKDSSGDLDYARAIAALSPAFDVFPANEACLGEARRSGIFPGCISATANVNSADCAKAYHDGDDAALARAVAVRKAFDGKPLVPGIKAVLAERLNLPGLARVMPPMVDASDEVIASLAFVRGTQMAAE
jgi:4-hydroxy-tetrahydrodipicolinate synthase